MLLHFTYCCKSRSLILQKRETKQMKICQIVHRYTKCYWRLPGNIKKEEHFYDKNHIFRAFCSILCFLSIRALGNICEPHTCAWGTVKDFFQLWVRNDPFIRDWHPNPNSIFTEMNKWAGINYLNTQCILPPSTFPWDTSPVAFWSVALALHSGFSYAPCPCPVFH